MPHEPVRVSVRCDAITWIADERAREQATVSRERNARTSERAGRAGEFHAILPPMLKRALRLTSDWVDLQWSLTIDSLERVAPQARGRLLDVGCGHKPYEHIFRPFLSE